MTKGNALEIIANTGKAFCGSQLLLLLICSRTTEIYLSDYLL